MFVIPKAFYNDANTHHNSKSSPDFSSHLLASEIQKPLQMTIGELRDELEDWPDGDEIIFGCEELEFYRLKKRGDDAVQLEFNQTIYKDVKTGKWHVDE
jgi:hypothetical protein